MNRLKTFFFGLLGIAILAGLLALVGWLIYAFFQYLSTVGWVEERNPASVIIDRKAGFINPAYGPTRST
jgi:hypothetical protein